MQILHSQGWYTNKLPQCNMPFAHAARKLAWMSWSFILILFLHDIVYNSLFFCNIKIRTAECMKSHYNYASPTQHQYVTRAIRQILATYIVISDHEAYGPRDH